MVLFLETSEEMPDDTYVARVLLGMGERGMLEQAAAVLVGRPKAWNFERQLTEEQKTAFVDTQYAAVLNSVATYCRDIPVVCGLDIGHTDPQLVLPYGGQVTVDPGRKRITVEY
jgi:muramoyltetrapeptide carboxypeptidase LdcA involved in peptidoglycan recycling